MNRIPIILIMVLTSLITFAQEYQYVPFPDSGAIWSEVYYYPEPGWPDTIIKPPSYERFTLNGEDTIINNITYKKLYIFSDSVFNESKATCIGGIREDENKRIYFMGDTIIHELKPISNFYNYEEIILYDFSVGIGDTIKNINSFPEYNLLVISGIDTILINNTLRKRISFDSMPWVKWIEGIGSIRGLLFASGDFLAGGPNGYLICFKQNSEILYFDNYYTECFPTITGIETIKNDHSNINLFPNPSNGDIKFIFGDHRFKSIQIIDCNGRFCSNFDVQLQSDFLLSLEKYQPGIYFYKATSKNGMVHTGKFVVQ